MKVHIGENIRSMRKQYNMTQEQLADTLGVSIAAVSKWERGFTTPDLSYIVEMAALFGVSMDALVGFQMQNESISELEAHIHNLQREKNFIEASIEAEKAVARYPNNFQIVFRSGEMYQMRGMETSDAPSLERAITLLNQAIPLLYQNTNPVICEALIQMEIAQCLLELGKETEGIEILKKHNVYGINDPLIGYTYASSENFSPDDAVPYLVRAFADCMQILIRTMCGYSNMFTRKHDYTSAVESMEWLIQYMESLKADTSEVTYADKLLAVFYAECSYLSGKEEFTERSRNYLRKAYQIAVQFDKEPTYKVKSLRFCVDLANNSTVFDGTGSTAIMAIENGFLNGSSTPEILQFWEELKSGTV